VVFLNIGNQAPFVASRTNGQLDLGGNWGQLARQIATSAARVAMLPGKSTAE
jgi:hypothetical protein